MNDPNDPNKESLGFHLYGCFFMVAIFVLATIIKATTGVNILR